LGALGEDRAAAWYVDHGYTVLDRNWRCRDGEIDLVCAKGGLVVICEVKARSGGSFGHPAEAVTPGKRRRLRGLAAGWLAEHGRDGRRAAVVRFDVAAVRGSAVEVIEDAF
jgi:putative endonuclease